MTVQIGALMKPAAEMPKLNIIHMVLTTFQGQRVLGSPSLTVQHTLEEANTNVSDF